MKLFYYLAALFSLITGLKTHAQDAQTKDITGTDNIVSTLRSSLSSVQYLVPGNITLAGNYSVQKKERLVIYFIKDELSISHFDVAMPDGKVIRFSATAYGNFSPENWPLGSKPTLAVPIYILHKSKSNIGEITVNSSLQLKSVHPLVVIGTQYIDGTINDVTNITITCSGLSDSGTIKHLNKSIERLRNQYIKDKEYELNNSQTTNQNVGDAVTNPSSGPVTSNPASNPAGGSGVSSSQTLAGNGSQQNTNTGAASNSPASGQPTELDFWGNPVQGSAKTANYGGMEVQDNSIYRQQMDYREQNAAARESWEEDRAAKRQAVDDHNNAVINDFYQTNARLQYEMDDMNNAFAQLGSLAGSGDITNPKTLITAGMGILKSAKTMKGVRIGSVVGGAGIVLGLLGGGGDSASEREAEERRREEEKKLKAAKEALHKARVGIFEAYPEGELPISSTKSSGNNLYYFAYGYNTAKLEEDEPEVLLTNSFAIGKYPDGTWPMVNKAKSQVTAVLAPHTATICGPFYSKQEAESVLTSFSGYLQQTAITPTLREFKGINAHSENSASSAPSTDFWGNPVNQNNSSQKKQEPAPARQDSPQLDFWGNPVKN